MPTLAYILITCGMVLIVASRVLPDAALGRHQSVPQTYETVSPPPTAASILGDSLQDSGDYRFCAGCLKRIQYHTEPCPACGTDFQTEMRLTATKLLRDAGNFEFAFRAYKEFAEKGVPEAQAQLAAMYFNGEGTPADAAEGARWYRSAAENGHSRVLTEVGMQLISKEPCTSEDIQEGIRWLTPAAEGGQVVAQAALGVLYSNARGVERDLEKAFAYLRQAAVAPHEAAASARYNLACTFAHVEHPSDHGIETYAWLLLAEEDGITEATPRLGALKRLMSAEEIETAQMIARDLRELIPAA